MRFLRKLLRPAAHAAPTDLATAATSQIGRCDRCAGPVPYETGYAFYCTSSFSVGGENSPRMELGNMLICDDCTESFITESYWRERVAELRKGELGPTTTPLSGDDLRKRNDVGIIALCFGLELSPKDAKAKAKKLARLYWRTPDKEAAEREIFRAWNEKRPRSGA